MHISIKLKHRGFDMRDRIIAVFNIYVKPL